MADTLIAGTTLVEKESRSIGDVPIGGIVPWLKNLSGVGNLPEGWVLCDGSAVSDALSPLNGVTIPDLNGNNSFLRGDDTAGGTGGSETHTHTLTPMTGIGDLGGSGQFTDQNTSTNSSSTLPTYHAVVWICRTR